jgi:succinate dehydrogenase/fumarate reductase cytochrome b subunit
MTQTQTDNPPVAAAAPGTDGAWSHRRRLLVVVLTTLSAGLVSAALLGPLVFGVMQYRTSPTMLNQLLGSDAAALFVVAPLCLVAAYLVARGNDAGPPLAAGLGVYAVYTYAQVIVGQEYLRLPGNVERFFPLLLAIFILAEATLVLAWRQLPSNLPPPSRRLERLTGWVLLLLSAFLVFGLHLRSMITAWTDPQSLTEYASAPTPFWLVKLMDLGIVVPVAVTTGIGLLYGYRWARRVLYPLLTGYTCLSISVSAMAAVMLTRDDPDSSLALAGGFGLFTLMLLALAAAVYRPLLFRTGHDAPATQGDNGNRRPA